MLDLEFTQPCLQLRHLCTEHLGTADLLLVMILTFGVSVALDTLAAQWALSVASLGSSFAVRQPVDHRRQTWTEHTILRFLQLRHALPRWRAFEDFIATSAAGSAVWQMRIGWRGRGRREEEKDTARGKVKR